MLRKGEAGEKCGHLLALCNDLVRGSLRRRRRVLQPVRLRHSLSDSGNHAVVLAPNVTPVPIPGNAFIPTYPYASGRYTNGEVWAQTLAFLLGLNADPSLLGGTDFAFGSAQTGPVGPISLSGGTVPPSLETQVALFLVQHGDTAPSTALYIVAGGGEDVLHALTTIEECGDHLGCINGVIRSTAASFAEDIGTIVSALQLAGASNIVVGDVPDVGDAPVAHALAGNEPARLAHLDDGYWSLKPSG